MGAQDEDQSDAGDREREAGRMGEKGNGRRKAGEAREGGAKQVPGAGKRSIGGRRGGKEERKERRWEGRKEGTSGLEGTKEKVREEGKRGGMVLFQQRRRALTQLCKFPFIQNKLNKFRFINVFA